MPAAPDLDTTVPVLMLRSDPCAIHHGSVAIARRLGRLGVAVYATVEDRFTPLAVSRYLTAAFVNTARDDVDLLTLVQTIGDEIAFPAILLPTDDRSAVFVAEHAQVLGRRFLFPPVRAELPRLLADKATLYALCKQHGISCPAYAVPTSMDEVEEFVAWAKFPIVLKAGEHSSRLGNRYSSCVIENRERLFALLNSENLLRQKVVLQEYIPGEDWIFHGYFNQQTNFFIGFTGRKLRSYPLLAGPTTLGVSIKNDELSALAETMLKTIGFSGIMDLDYRCDERDGSYRLVDFNPRVGANFRMFEDGGALDVVRALHLDLTGRPVPRARRVEGRTFVVELHDILAAVALLRRRQMTIRSWIRSLAGKRELAWWSWNDPFPFLAMVVRLLIRAGGRGMRSRLRQVRARLNWAQLRLFSC